MGAPFWKYEGLGNDFVVVEDRFLCDWTPERARAICDRRRGVGADGVLVVDPEVPSMHVINADGSVAEMCGNGLRCVVLHLARRGLFPTGEERAIETGAGPHQAILHALGAVRTDAGVLEEGDVEIAMLAPSLLPGDAGLAADAPLVDAPLEHTSDDAEPARGLAALRLTAVGMGNPHAVTFDDVGEARRDLGPAVQADAHFPEGTNVGFAREIGEDLFELHVFERGSGWTEACGTGACAAAAAAVATGRAQPHRALTMRLPGGDLQVTIGESGTPARMRGPARFVFAGELPALELA